MTANDKYDFDPRKFLAAIGEDRHVLAFPARQTIFAQGDAADSVFYVVKGKVRLTAVSKIGKQATLGILSEGNFSEKAAWLDSLTPGVCNRNDALRTSAHCELLRIDKKAMMLALHRKHTFSDLFVAHTAGTEYPL